MQEAKRKMEAFKLAEFRGSIWMSLEKLPHLCSVWEGCVIKMFLDVPKISGRGGAT